MESKINWQARYNELQDAYMKERAGLQAKCERYEKALKNISNAPNPSASESLSWIIAAYATANDALSAGDWKNGEERICIVCGKSFMAITDVVCSEECYFNLPNQKEDQQ